ncbi:hypothetical protein ACQZV8_02895 [Magnetococcales bacterium HHB-1]
MLITRGQRNRGERRRASPVQADDHAEKLKRSTPEGGEDAAPSFRARWHHWSVWLAFALVFLFGLLKIIFFE